MTGFREHFKNVATFDLNMNIDNKYHDMVEDEIQIINDIVAHESIEETNDASLCLTSSTLIHLLNSFLDSFFSLHIMLFICVGFPLSFHILYFAFIILSADLDLYSAKVQTDIDQLKSQLINNEWALDNVISKTSQVMKNAAI
jgi:hypothetical protein